MQAKQPRELFKESDVDLIWKSIQKSGAGLQNLGNTCFMNAALQCLIHTPPLAQALLSRDFSQGQGGQGQFDPLSITQQLIRRAYSGASIFSPVAHASNLKMFNKRFKLGRQEDSHELLRCLLDGMHEACLKQYQPKPSPDAALTSLIYRVFGGKLRSQIRCEGVDYQSSKVDPFLDLSLDIGHASSVRRALQHFTSPEILKGDNKYRCPTNGKLVCAVKQISIHEPPNVLTLHLKRFEFGHSASKISKRIEFDIELDLAPFMSSLGPTGKGQPQGSGHIYDLYGVLVHHGYSVLSGHYLSYVRNSSGVWQQCDDTRVSTVSEREVLNQQAYILFYIRRFPKHAHKPHVPSAAPQASGPAAAPAPSMVLPLPNSIRKQQLSKSKSSEDSALDQPSRNPSLASERKEDPEIKNKTMIIPTLAAKLSWFKEEKGSPSKAVSSPISLRQPASFRKLFQKNSFSGLGKVVLSIFHTLSAQRSVNSKASKGSVAEPVDEPMDEPADAPLETRVCTSRVCTSRGSPLPALTVKKEKNQQKRVKEEVVAKEKSPLQNPSASSEEEPSTEIHTGADAVRMLGATPHRFDSLTSSLSKVGKWNDEDDNIAPSSFNSPHGHAAGVNTGMKRPARDEWDEEYDRGKLKKVKSSEPRRGSDLHAGGNAFQQEWSERHGGSGRGGRGGRSMSRGGGGRGRGGSRDGERDRGGRGGRGRGRSSFGGDDRGGRSGRGRFDGGGRGGFRGGFRGRGGGGGRGRESRGRGRGGGGGRFGHRGGSSRGRF